MGGVIINLDLDKTFSQFASAVGSTPGQIKKQYFNAQLWQSHEIGAASDTDIRNEIRTHFFPKYTDNQIDDIWNAMLLDIPKERINLLLKLRNKYQIFLLSNTNEIHRKKFNEILFESHGIKDFSEIFHKTYYSHQMGLRKPNPKIYEVVLREQNLIASETLFLDDNAENLNSAQGLGIQTELVTPQNSMIELLSGL